MDKSNSRTKKMVINSLSGGILGMVTMITGFLLPRFIIQVYGPEMNGLSVSVRQLVNYLSYIELGVYPMFFSALFKPLATNDTKKINGIVNEAKKTYHKFSLIYLIILIAGVIIFPFVINRGEIPIIQVALLTLLFGTNGLLNLFVLSRYRVLFSADQKLYIIKVFDIIQTIVTTALQVVAILLKADILIVFVIPIPFVLLKGLYFNYIQKNKYPYIDYHSKEKAEVGIKKTDAFVFEFSVSLISSLPILALSTFASLTDVNVYSVYNLVFLGLGTILSMFTSGSTASFGNLLAESHYNRVETVYKEFYVLVNIISVILFGTALFLILPFIKLYLGAVDDISVYIKAFFPLLFVGYNYLSNLSIPSLNIIRASGKYKTASIITVSSLIIELILVFLLTFFYKIPGALIGLIIGSFIKFIFLAIFVEKKVVPKTLLFSLLNLFLALAIMFGSYFLVEFLGGVVINQILPFVLYGLLFVIIYFILSIIVNFIFNKQEVISLGRRIKMLFKNKK